MLKKKCAEGKRTEPLSAVWWVIQRAQKEGVYLQNRRALKVVARTLHEADDKLSLFIVHTLPPKRHSCLQILNRIHLHTDSSRISSSHLDLFMLTFHSLVAHSSTILSERLAANEAFVILVFRTYSVHLPR